MIAVRIVLTLGGLQWPMIYRGNAWQVNRIF